MSVMSSIGTAFTLPSGLVVSNRIAKAAMSEALATSDGAPSPELIRLYETWGNSGAGILITGNVILAREGRTEPRNVVLEDARHLPELTAWARAAQAHGAKLFMQINHAGRQVAKSIARVPVGPSAVPMKGFGGLFATPRALEVEEIEALIARFANAASIAKQAGFAGVQIHAAHGYLLSQFLSPLANVRTDAYGGDPVRRRRMLIEVVRAVRASVGADYPIAVKLNSADFQRGGFSAEESMDVVRSLESEGIDLLEISGGNYEAPAMMSARAPTRAGQAERSEAPGQLPRGEGRSARAIEQSASSSTRSREAYFLEYATQVRAVTGLPLLLTGGMRTRATITRVLGEGVVDFVGLGRPMAYEPDLPRRLLEGASATRAPDVRTGFKRLDDMLQIAWFQAQLHRLGRGEPADPTLSKWRVLFDTIRKNLRRAPSRPMLPATVEAA